MQALTIMLRMMLRIVRTDVTDEICIWSNVYRVCYGVTDQITPICTHVFRRLKVEGESNRIYRFCRVNFWRRSAISRESHGWTGVFE